MVLCLCISFVFAEQVKCAQAEVAWAEKKSKVLAAINDHPFYHQLDHPHQTTLSKMAYTQDTTQHSQDLKWLLVRNSNKFLVKQKGLGKIFSREPGNLRQIHSYTVST